MSRPAIPRNDSDEFDPHSEGLTRRDWTFLAYLVGLSLLALILVGVGIVWTINTHPNFSNFEEGPSQHQAPATERSR